MFITINGQLGSGKSEICRILKEEHGFDIFHTGKIQRAYAEELGISTLELNELCKTDHRYDAIIDGKLVEYAERERGNKVVFDSRMAWHFVKDTFKVHLLVAPDIAANRVFFNRIDKAEVYKTKEEAMQGLISRRKVEGERYELLYNVKMLKYSNYDLVLDTSTTSIREEVKIILQKAKEYFLEGEKAMLLSPTNVYPTNTDLGGEGIKVVKYDESIYVVGGLELVKQAISEGKNLIEVELLGEDDDVIGDVKVSDLIDTELNTLARWEKENNIKFGFIADYVKSRS
ncbi:MAG: cytidylate kinase family protein [Clostridia bacterium]|nr:cytidylate kinase family protein [Clostridia bacterium]